MTSANPQTSSSADREIVITRRFDAPRELVFDAFTDPKHIGHWWGPKGFSITTHSMEVRSGGSWRFIMHGPDGTNYDNHIIYDELVRPQLLVYRHLATKEGERGLFTTRITLEAQGSKTLLTMRAVFKNKEERDEVVEKHNAIEGGKQTLERLAGYLASRKVAPFVIARTFNAPRALVWQAWTETDHMKNWWGPKGCTILQCSLDLRPGGMFHYCMKYFENEVTWGRFVFKEILPVEKIVWVNSFSDEKGGLSRHPMHAAWPLEMLTTLTLTEDAGKTTLRIEWVPLSPSDEEAQTFDAGRSSMTQGWSGTFEQLAEYLSKSCA